MVINFDAHPVEHGLPLPKWEAMFHGIFAFFVRYI